MSVAFEVSNVECLDLAKSSFGISTGVGFLDHMLDQFNSHAQVGVAITVSPKGQHQVDNVSNRNRHASYSQEALQATVGAALGTQLKSILMRVPDGSTSRFCCPLDEALVECIITKGKWKTGRVYIGSIWNLSFEYGTKQDWRNGYPVH